MTKFARESQKLSITCGTEVVASAMVRALAGSLAADRPEIDEIIIGADGCAKVQGNRRQRRMAESYNRSRRAKA